MEGELAEKKQASSYTYWVRESNGDAAPLPQPRKLSADDVAKQSNSTTLGSVWNQAGTWEEKNLNSWASCKLKDLLKSIELEFSSGRACVEELSKCSGDAFRVTVRNRKRVGYTYELSLKFRGEWMIQKEKTKIKGNLDLPEFSFGELDDLKIEVRLSDTKDLSAENKAQICKDLQLFLKPIREQLDKFEQEIKDR